MNAIKLTGKHMDPLDEYLLYKVSHYQDLRQHAKAGKWVFETRELAKHPDSSAALWILKATPELKRIIPRPEVFANEVVVLANIRIVHHFPVPGKGWDKHKYEYYIIVFPSLDGLRLWAQTNLSPLGGSASWPKRLITESAVSAQQLLRTAGRAIRGPGGRSSLTIKLLAARSGRT